MEDQKEVTEKRLSRGVIRRRASPEQEAKRAAEAAKAAIVETQPAAEQESKESPAVVVAPVEKPIEKPVEKPVVAQPIVRHIVKVDTSQGRKLTLDDKQKELAERHVQNNLNARLQKQEEQKAAQSARVAAKESDSKDDVVAKKIEKDVVLTFKERVKGTIDLSKFNPVSKKTAVGPSDDVKLIQRMGMQIVEEEEDSKGKKDKVARVKKSVKDIGGDLDIDGLGRAAHLSQLVRTSPMDRVFRPGAPGRGGRKKKIVSKKSIKQTSLTTMKASKRVVEIDKTITVSNLAQTLGVKAGEIIKQLMNLGVMASINQSVDKDTAALIAAEYQYEVKDVSFNEANILSAKQITSDEDRSSLPLRAPIVTIMGHVDHGKTSLLDAIRSTDVTSSEAGGITQHIGAYTITLPEGRITFLDTPGHEAFTTMRSRGAQVTDFVILVVAADDGMMPQTEESIDHAKAAGVPIIVAINKIDKEEADPDRIKRQLSEKGLVPEEWGGDTIYNLVSAKQKTGVKELLDSIIVQSEVLDLRAVIDARAQGFVIEAKLDRNRGPLATFLVQSGTLKVGDYVVAGSFVGKVKALSDWTGKPIDGAGPSMAVEVLGLEGVPDAGDKFNVVESEQDARKVVEFRIDEKRKIEQAPQAGVTLEDMFTRMKAGEMCELNIILKTDVQGSLEAVRDAILKIGNAEVKARIIHAAVGGINESDVRLATASQAIIIGFNVRPETKAIHVAKDVKIEIKLYKIIYELVNEVKLAMQGLLAPEIKENYLGRAEVRQAFEVSKLGLIAGCMVVDGTIQRTANLRLLRDNVVMFEGKVASLRRFKEDAREVKQGFECGVGLEGYKDIKAGDVIEAYEIQKIQRTL